MPDSDPSLPSYLTKTQQEYISKKTPAEYIKERPGPSGKTLKYVEVGYIITTLNQTFGWNWDFDIIDHQIGKQQVWVKGELTIRTNSQSIVKTQFCGSDIRMNRQQQAISIADDLKAATSDCLKKCASMLGIAGDVYWANLDSD